MKLIIKCWLFILMLVSLASCNNGSIFNSATDNNLKAITAFSFPSSNGLVNSTIIGNNILITMPFATNLKSLIATFKTTGVNVKVGNTVQVSGITSNDFTNPVIYTVTAVNGSKRDYTVTVTVAPSDAKAITSYSIEGYLGKIIGNNISVTVPYGTNITDLIAIFTTTGINIKVGNVKQINGVTQNNFTTPIVYTVIAADGTTKQYTVTVTVAPSDAKAITSYSIEGYIGKIIGNNISVVMPYGTDVKDLIATFLLTGTNIKVGNVKQINGVTQNDFTNPVVYTVIAADGTTKQYTVTVTVATIDAKAITSYSIEGYLGKIIGDNISVTIPYGTNITDLIATFTTTGINIKVGNVKQLSGATQNNFIAPLFYTVTAADGSIRNYTVTVTLTTSSFLPYYPKNCVLNNAAAGIKGSCNCIQDSVTGNIWITTGISDFWLNWCNHIPGTAGYDINCPANQSNMLDFWNLHSMCGLTGGWHLPSALNPNSNNLSSDNPGGDWSDLYILATSGSAQPGNIYMGGDLSIWMNNNGFENISATPLNTSLEYWSSKSFDKNTAWIIYLRSSNINLGANQNTSGVLLVHSRQ